MQYQQVQHISLSIQNQLFLGPLKFNDNSHSREISSQNQQRSLHNGAEEINYVLMILSTNGKAYSRMPICKTSLRCVFTRTIASNILSNPTMFTTRSNKSLKNETSTIVRQSSSKYCFLVPRVELRSLPRPRKGPPGSGTSLSATLHPRLDPSAPVDVLLAVEDVDAGTGVSGGLP